MHTIRNCTFILFFCVPLLLLSACDTGSGYKTKPSQSRLQLPASAAPDTINNATTSTEQSQQAQEPNYPPVNVAILLPLSGKHQDLGEAMLNAAQIALFDVGHSNFNLIPRDTLGTEDGARQAAKSAVDANVDLILGPLFASSVRAAKPIASRARTNMIAFSTDWTLAGDTTYIMGFLPFDQVRRITEYAANQNIQRVGILTPNTNYGRAVGNLFETLALRNGIATTASMSFQPRSGNLAPTIRAFTRYEERQAAGLLNQAPFDAVLMPTGGEDARSIANLISHNNLPPRRVKRLGTGLLDDPALATEANLDGAWFAAPSPTTRVRFENRYRETFAQKPPRLSTLAYDATALAATLARQGFQMGKRDPYSRADLTNPNGFFGIDGIFRFRPDGTAERGLAILSFRNGEIVVIDETPKTFQKAVQ
jgi:branched-chain amino acid transport system substrate-binding protein